MVFDEDSMRDAAWKAAFPVRRARGRRLALPWAARRDASPYRRSRRLNLRKDFSATSSPSQT